MDSKTTNNIDYEKLVEKLTTLETRLNQFEDALIKYDAAPKNDDVGLLHGIQLMHQLGSHQYSSMDNYSIQDIYKSVMEN